MAMAITPFAECDSDSDNDLNNPFLMGLAINIPKSNDNDCDMSDFESCDDDFECGNVTDFESEHTETETIFNMKKYEYISNIGIGAFGIVDKVFDPINNRFVAIKVRLYVCVFLYLYTLFVFLTLQSNPARLAKKY